MVHLIILTEQTPFCYCYITVLIFSFFFLFHLQNVDNFIMNVIHISYPVLSRFTLQISEIFLNWQYTFSLNIIYIFYHLGELDTTNECNFKWFCHLKAFIKYKSGSMQNKEQILKHVLCCIISCS